MADEDLLMFVCYAMNILCFVFGGAVMRLYYMDKEENYLYGRERKNTECHNKDR